MSKCISTHGEYSEHTFGDGEDEFTCTLCYVLDEDAIRAELKRVRNTNQKLAARIGGMVESINDQMRPEILRQKAAAWDEGVAIALDRAVRQDDGITLKLEHMDGSPWPNPYRAEES